MSDIYEPQEDSFLLEKEVKKIVSKLAEAGTPPCVLDMGAGSGIQAKAAAKAGAKHVLAVDINPKACKELLHFVEHNENQKDRKDRLGVIEVRESDLFENIKEREQFDLIIFNAPYLPEEKQDPDIALDGGLHGHELIACFLDNAGKYLNKKGRILLLFSTRSGFDQVLAAITRNSFLAEELASQYFFFEQIIVYSLQAK